MKKAQDVLNVIKSRNDVFASHRYDGYLERRRELEQTARDIFISKGGKPVRNVPHYMVIGECKWLQSWYNEGEYRRNVYTYEEIVELIHKYGLPQEWNEDGRYGPERYIEVQVWSGEPLKRGK